MKKFFTKHKYLYCAIFYINEAQANGFVDGIYSTNKKIIEDKDLIDLKYYIEEKHNISIKNFTEMSVVTLTYLGKK